MYLKYICTLFICLTLFSGCFIKKSKEDSSFEKFSKLGVQVNIPENFSVLPQEILAEMEKHGGATALDVEPFLVNLLHAYTENSGKGTIIVSELNFQDGFTPEKFAINNLYIYKNNLETFFNSGEISSEEIGNDDMTTVLLAMIFNEDDDDIFLFKSLNYVYPNLYFMIDLYVIDKEISQSDVMGYINMFDSLSLY
jgi:hypothetical protein